MYVDVYKRKQLIEQVQPDDSTCLISISTPTIGSPLIDPQYEDNISAIGWLDILRLQFHDAIHRYYDDMTLFDEQLAGQTVRFIKQNKDKNFVVHCDAGQSRSVSVGRFINKVYGHTLTLHATRVDSSPKGNELVTSQLYKVHEQSTK